MIFKKLQKDDKNINIELERKHIDGSNTYFLKNDEWQVTDDNQYDEYNSISTNLKTVNNVLGVGYGSLDGNNSEKLTWDFVCNKFGIDSKEPMVYDYKTFEDFIVLSFKNVENYHSLDLKNIFFSFANKTSTQFDELIDRRFSSTTDVVTVLSKNKSSFVTKTVDSDKLRQTNTNDVYDLHKSSASEKLLTLNEMPQQIINDNVDYKSFEKCGIVFPNHGICIIFPELLNSTIRDSIRNRRSSDKVTTIIETLMGFGAYFLSTSSNLNLYIRLLNNEFNVSNNVSAYSLYNDEQEYNDNITNVYITNLLMCNDSNEILAYIKFDEPLKKNSVEEYLSSTILKTQK